MNKALPNNKSMRAYNFVAIYNQNTKISAHGLTTNTCAWLVLFGTKDDGTKPT